MTDFRVKLRPKPGTIAKDGSILGCDGLWHAAGPCFVPPVKIDRRAIIMNAAGWRWIRDVTKFPGIPPTQGAICIERKEPTT